LTPKFLSIRLTVGPPFLTISFCRRAKMLRSVANIALETSRKKFLRKPPLNRRNEAHTESVGRILRRHRRSTLCTKPDPRLGHHHCYPVGRTHAPRHRPAQMPRNRSFVFGNIALALKIISGCVDPVGSWRRRPVAVLAGIKALKSALAVVQSRRDWMHCRCCLRRQARLSGRRLRKREKRIPLRWRRRLAGSLLPGIAGVAAATLRNKIPAPRSPNLGHTDAWPMGHRTFLLSRTTVRRGR
jgi:hypothetical protein